jgi:Protein of unknown function (DUF2891)
MQARLPAGIPAVRSAVRMRLDSAAAQRFAELALANVDREYPNHTGHVWFGDGDALPPRALHPAFHGSYDWHSAVHMHWLLARLRREFPALPARAAIDACFGRHLAPEAIAAECAYFERPGTRTFERTYGWAWLLKLAAELETAGIAGDATAARWASALAPLTACIVARFHEYLPRAQYPIRHGTHANSAFGLALAFDHALACGNQALASLLREKALAWFGGDRDAPLAWEPSGADFLSPALMEAALMRRVSGDAAFTRWLAGFLPALGSGPPIGVLVPVRVSDRADPQIVHLDGLNLSRAWCLAAIAGAFAADHPVATQARQAAAAHRAAGAEGLASADYVGSHWLATFAVLAELDDTRVAPA